MGAVAYQAFENMRTVRSFAGEALERERFQAQVRRRARARAARRAARRSRRGVELRARHREGEASAAGARPRQGAARLAPPSLLTPHPSPHPAPRPPKVAASYAAGREFGAAKANFEATNRAAIHASLLMLYAWGGYLVSQGLMPISVLISGIGFTFSLMYATQGAVNTLSDLRRASGAFERVRFCLLRQGFCFSGGLPRRPGLLSVGPGRRLAGGGARAGRPRGPGAANGALLRGGDDAGRSQHAVGPAPRVGRVRAGAGRG